MVKDRLDYIDWLRVLAVLVLYPFHTGEIFSTHSFYVKNETISTFLMFVNSLIHYWHMPLFMLLAGIGSYYALKHRSERAYIAERFKRIFVPLLFGILVIIPPQSFLRLYGDPERVWPRGFQHNAPGPGYSKNFFQFYPDFFNGIFPNGNLEWGHLWFLAYLFTFSCIAVPVFFYLKSEKGKALIDRLAKACERRYAILSLMVPLAIFEVAFRWKFPGLQNLIADWANFFTYLTLFIYGYIIMSDLRFSNAIDRIWRESLFIGFSFCLILANLYISGFYENLTSPLLYVISMIMRSFVMWSLLIGILGMGKAFLNHGGAFINYAREAALPYYILHQTVILIVGFFIVQFDASIPVKFFSIVILSMVSTALVYEFVVRRITVLRWCFGMK